MSSVTLRTPVQLPSMPRESEAMQALRPITMARSQLLDGRLEFDRADGFDQAMSQGFFLLKMPPFVDFTPADLFAQHFFERPIGDDLDVYRGFREIGPLGPYQGYFDRDHDQWENFYIEMSNWGLLPPGVAEVGHSMTDLGVQVLRNVLERVAAPGACWAKATSGLSERRGHHMLAFNHFRSQRPMRGSKFHRDSGWVTVLRSREPGLLALVHGELQAINPEPGYLIVNFGSSIEVLTECTANPVRANIHGVCRTERQSGRADRTSYVVFLDSSLDGRIYRLEGDVLRDLQSVAEFAIQEVGRTYDDVDTAL